MDSNAWEAIFDEETQVLEPIRVAIKTGRLQGLMCETNFQIECIQKKDRPNFFSEPKMATPIRIEPQHDGRVRISMTMGSDNSQHPGIPEAQSSKLECALAHGVRLMRGIAWLGLPSPFDRSDSELFFDETMQEKTQHDQCRADLAADFHDRQVGRFQFEEQGGWNGGAAGKKFNRACAEWADAELVISHICYGNDVLCTNDRARGTGKSVFDLEHRKWLSSTYGTRFMTTIELRSLVLKS